MMKASIGGFQGPAECVETKSGCKANLVLIPRSNKKDMKIIPFDSPLCVLHFANAFQDEDTITIGKLVEFLSGRGVDITTIRLHSQ